MIGELNELANYGLSKVDVKRTLEELKEMRCVKFPEHFLDTDARNEVQALNVSSQRKSHHDRLCL